MFAIGAVPGFLCLLLQEAAPGAAAGERSPSLFEGLIGIAPPLLLCFVVFYFLILRPQKKQQLAHQRLLDGIKKGDSVRTTSGIFGRVVSVEKEKNLVVLKIDDQNNVRIRILRSAIDAIVGEEKGSPAGDDRAVEKAKAV